jgi:hypothetical protein
MNLEFSNSVVKASRSIVLLAMLMILNVAVIILLTPIGFESRPQSALEPLGYIAIASIFIGLALDLASIVLLFKRTRVRLASGLSIVSSIMFFLIIFVDRTGSFFSVPIPAAIITLEYLFIALLIPTLIVASKVYIDSKPISS